MSVGIRVISTVTIAAATLAAAIASIEGVRAMQSRLYSGSDTSVTDSNEGRRRTGMAVAVRHGHRGDSMWEPAESVEAIQKEIDNLFRGMFMVSSNLSWPSEHATPRLRDDPAQEGQLFNHMHQMQAQIDEVFRRSFDDFGHFGGSVGFDEGWDRLLAMPGMDLRDDGSNYVVSVSLPGVEKSDLQVTLDGSLLTVTAQHKPALTSSAAEGPSSHAILAPGRVERRLRLPGAVSRPSDARACFENGVLRVTVPRESVAESVEKRVVIQ